MTLTGQASLPVPAVNARPGPRPLAWWRHFGRAPRIMGLDVARALAVVGMIGAHLGETGEFAFFDPSSWTALVHGRSSILFAVLAGISIALMTGRARIPEREEMPRIRLGLIGRGAAIFAIGVALELLGTPIAVILTVYGILYVLAIPFLRWRALSLLIAAGVLALAGPVLLSGIQSISLGASGPGLDLVLFGTYPVTVWMAFVLGGMAVGRMQLERVRTVVALLLVGLVMAAAGYGLGAWADTVQGADDGMSSSSYASSSWSQSSSSYLSGVPAEELDFSDKICDDGGDGYLFCYPQDEALTEEDGIDDVAIDEGAGWAAYPGILADHAPLESMGQAFVSVWPHSGGSAEIVGSGGFSVALIALCLLLSRPLRWVLLPLAALGSMPLTAYSAHIVVILAFAGPGGLISGNAEWGILSLSLVVLATLWAMFLGRGPLERLVGRAAEAMAAAPTQRRS